MNKFILLRTYNSLTEAELDFIKLRDEELDVYMADNNMASIMPHYALAVGGIKIFIAEDQFQKGYEVISYERNQESDVNELLEDENPEPSLVCPNCGSSNYFQERSFFLGILILLLFILPVSIGNNINHCVNCDHRWKIN
tara:strand:+ start:29032 stop:29451 length:420 start_codon:yes stop_codon:yes gene_type:complete